MDAVDGWIGRRIRFRLRPDGPIEHGVIENVIGDVLIVRTPTGVQAGLGRALCGSLWEFEDAAP